MSISGKMRGYFLAIFLIVLVAILAAYGLLRSRPEFPVFVESPTSLASSLPETPTIMMTPTLTPANPTLFASPTRTNIPSATESIPRVSITLSPTLKPATQTPLPTPSIPAGLSPTSALPNPLQAVTTPAKTTTPNPVGSSCRDLAVFVDDITIPDNTSFKQNIPFVKTWRIRNEGTCSWEGYSLVFYGGNAMDGAPSNPLPLAQPGQMVDISLNLKSPASAGTFSGYWVFQNTAGKRFGVNSVGIDPIWVKIGVSIYDPQNTPVAVVGGASASTPPAACTSQENPGYVQDVLARINAERAKLSLPALKISAKLSAAANMHSQDMGCNRFVDHIGSNGSTWFNRITTQGYAYASATENIYVGDPDFGGTPEGALKWWMNSQIHRNNILDPKVSEIGVGYAYITGSPFKGYFTLNFARPKN